MASAGRDPRAPAALAAAKHVSFQEEKQVYEYKVKTEMWHFRQKARKRHHMHTGLLPRAESIQGARRKALNLAKELKYDLPPVPRKGGRTRTL